MQITEDFGITQSQLDEIRGNRKNVKSFENLMNEMYGVNLQY